LLQEPEEQKEVFFDRQLPSDVGGIVDAFPSNMAKKHRMSLCHSITKGIRYRFSAIIVIIIAIAMVVITIVSENENEILSTRVIGLRQGHERS